MYNIKHTILAAFIAFMAFSSSRADAETWNSIVVSRKGNAPVSIALSEDLELSYTRDFVSIRHGGNEFLALPIDESSFFYLSPDPGQINSARPDFIVGVNSIEIDIPEGPVSLMNEEGILISSYNNASEIPLSTLSPGIYILKTPGTSFKFLRR